MSYNIHILLNYRVPVKLPYTDNLGYKLQKNLYCPETLLEKGSNDEQYINKKLCH